MAYNALNNLIDAYIYANGVQAITGQILNGVLKQMVSQLGSGYHLMGVADPETVPASNDYAMAYFAATAGEYTDFGGITLAAGEVAVLLTYGNGSWSKQTIYNVPTGTADLENTANFITNAVTDLVNYYTKTEVDDTLANYPTLEGLATALADYYDKTEVETLISSAGNGEDIDSNPAGKLQFANRVYNAQQPNGMGYKILRKDATFASQVTDTNTIYEIRYDFDLNNASVTIPAGCVLKFNGGVLSNGTLVGQSTGIDANLVQILENVKFSGVWDCDSFVEWFGIDYTEGVDNSSSINNALVLAGLGRKHLLLPGNKTIYTKAHDENWDYNTTKYLREGNIEIPSGVTLDLNGSTLKAITNNQQSYNILYSHLTDKIVIRNGTIEGDAPTHDFSGGGSQEWGYGIELQGCSNFIIEDVVCKNCIGDGINLQLWLTTGKYNERGLIRRVDCNNNGRNSLSIESCDGLIVEDSSFSDATRTDPKAGIDIEPSLATDRTYNIEIRNCSIKNNGKFGIAIQNNFGDQYDLIHGIKIEKCIFSGNIQENTEIAITSATEIIVSGCSLEKRISPQSSSLLIDNTKFKGLYILSDHTLGRNVTIARSKFNAISFLGNISSVKLDISDCEITGLASIYTGIEIPSSATGDINFTRCVLDYSGSVFSDTNKALFIQNNVSLNFYDCTIRGIVDSFLNGGYFSGCIITESLFRLLGKTLNAYKTSVKINTTSRNGVVDCASGTVSFVLSDCYFDVPSGVTSLVKSSATISSGRIFNVGANRTLIGYSGSAIVDIAATPTPGVSWDKAKLSPAVPGMIIIDNGKMIFHNGSAWVNMDGTALS